MVTKATSVKWGKHLKSFIYFNMKRLYWIQTDVLITFDETDFVHKSGWRCFWFYPTRDGFQSASLKVMGIWNSPYSRHTRGHAHKTNAERCTKQILLRKTIYLWVNLSSYNSSSSYVWFLAHWFLKDQRAYSIVNVCVFACEHNLDGDGYGVEPPPPPAIQKERDEYRVDPPPPPDPKVIVYICL